VLSVRKEAKGDYEVLPITADHQHSKMNQVKQDCVSHWRLQKWFYEIHSMLWKCAAGTIANVETPRLAIPVL
jgi:hypothetical protein